MGSRAPHRLIISYAMVYLREHLETTAGDFAEAGEQHHVGLFPQLEDQMANFTSDFDREKAGYSPDRLDALVFIQSGL